MDQVHFASDVDPEMQKAKETARVTFRYFWREMAWEHRRIVPALELAAVKVVFRDLPEEAPVEEMWIGEINFDGRMISGRLLNQPNWLKSIQEGDYTQVALGKISDWMYAMSGRVYGAHTVNLLRSKMSRLEREEHDSAWDLDFGDPGNVLIVPSPPTIIDPVTGMPGEHPMALNMGKSLEDYIKSDARALSKDDSGFTLLHHLALAGTPSGVSILLANGANPNELTDHGLSPVQLAKALGWGEVAALLVAH